MNEDTPFAIGKRTGEIHIKGSALVLRAAMTKSEFLASELYRRTAKARYFPLENGSGHTFLVRWHDPAFENVYLWLNFENDQLGWGDFGWGPPITAAQWTQEVAESVII